MRHLSLAGILEGRIARAAVQRLHNGASDREPDAQRPGSQHTGKMLEALFRSSPDAMLVLDDSRRIALFNSGSEQMFSYAPNDVVGQPVEILLPEKIAEQRWTSPLPHFLLREDGTGHTSTRLALYGRRRDGEIFSVDASVASASVARAPGFLVVMRDATAIRQSEGARRECEERFRIAFGAETIAFAITELSGRLRAVNRSLCDMIGYTREELLGRSFVDITFPDDRPADFAQLNRLLAGDIDRYRLEKRWVHKDGHLVWALMSVSLARDSVGAPAYFVAQATDITALKDAQQELAERAAELERSNAELEQFAYVASHDLQEPLRTVTSYVQLLSERYHARLDERADRWMTYMVGGVDRMKRLIEGMLSLARVRTDGGEFQRTNTAVIVDDLWRQLSGHTSTDDVCLSRGPLPTVVADPEQLEQLFQNLLSNAIRYRRPAVPLQVNVSAERLLVPSGAEWLFVVEDNGVGLDMAYATRIFEIFQRVPREEDHGGSGIGLAICERIVRRHGGRIWVESTPGRGSRFCFTLVEQTS